MPCFFGEGFCAADVVGAVDLDRQPLDGCLAAELGLYIGECRGVGEHRHFAGGVAFGDDFVRAVGVVGSEELNRAVAQPSRGNRR